MPIEFDTVQKVFGKPPSQVIALDGLSLTVNDGEFMCILGPSGCGKSTLLFMASGLEKPTRGVVRNDGKTVTGPGADRGMLFQQFALYPWRSARRNIEFGLEIRGIPAEERWKRARVWLDIMGLAQFANAYPHQLSGGMQQRIAIARLLVNEPEVLLMDEPFASLDAQTRTALGEELVRVWQHYQRTVLFVTHSIDEAIMLADRLVVMTRRPGRIKVDMPIQIPRPRDPASDEFNHLRKTITEFIRHEVHSTPEEPHP